MRLMIKMLDVFYPLFFRYDLAGIIICFCIYRHMFYRYRYISSYLSNFFILPLMFYSPHLLFVFFSSSLPSLSISFISFSFPPLPTFSITYLNLSLTPFLTISLSLYPHIRKRTNQISINKQIHNNNKELYKTILLTSPRIY